MGTRPHGKEVPLSLRWILVESVELGGKVEYQVFSIPHPGSPRLGRMVHPLLFAT
jgi:hypothetical protein